MKSLYRLVFCCLAVCAGSASQGVWAEDSEVQFRRRQLDREHGKVQVFDVDKDGRNDVMKIQSEGESLAWYKFRDRQEVSKYVVFRDRRFRADRMGVADIDGDGDMDVVTGLEEGNTREVIWLENPLPNGHPAQLGAWGLHKVGPQSDYIKDIGSADFNHDGRLDIVTRTHTETALFVSRASSPRERGQDGRDTAPLQWSPPRLLQHESHEGMDLADLDRDGDPDIVSIAWRDYQYLHLWRNDAVKKGPDR